MDPYQDLRVLQQMSSLTWLRVFVHGDYDPNEYLAFAFPQSLHFLESRCNQKRYSRSGAVYLRTPDRVRPLCCNELMHLLKLLDVLFLYYASVGCDKCSGLRKLFLSYLHMQGICSLSFLCGY